MSSVQRGLGGGSSAVWGDGDEGGVGVSSFGNGGTGRDGGVGLVVRNGPGVAKVAFWVLRLRASRGMEMVVNLGCLASGSYIDSMSVASPLFSVRAGSSAFPGATVRVGRRVYGVCLLRLVRFLLLFLTSAMTGAGPFARVARAEEVSFTALSLGGSADMVGGGDVGSLARHAST